MFSSQGAGPLARPRAPSQSVGLTETWGQMHCTLWAGQREQLASRARLFHSGGRSTDACWEGIPADCPCPRSRPTCAGTLALQGRGRPPPREGKVSVSPHQGAAPTEVLQGGGQLWGAPGGLTMPAGEWQHLAPGVHRGALCPWAPGAHSTQPCMAPHQPAQSQLQCLPSPSALAALGAEHKAAPRPIHTQFLPTPRAGSRLLLLPRCFVGAKRRSS